LFCGYLWWGCRFNDVWFFCGDVCAVGFFFKLGFIVCSCEFWIQFGGGSGGWVVGGELVGVGCGCGWCFVWGAGWFVDDVGLVVVLGCGWVVWNFGGW